MKPPYDLSAESNARYLSDYSALSGVFKTKTGLMYRIIKSGAGASPKSAEDMVTVRYKGMLVDGWVFDQTQNNETAAFPAGRLIPGWVEALSLMKEGDEWELVVPSDLGYGPEGAGGGEIPGNQTLTFQMTLVGVTPARP